MSNARPSGSARWRRLGLLASAALAVPAALLGTASDAGAAPVAPAAQGDIHPGVQMYTKGAQCTANFVFRDAKGRTYVGYAAHCAGLGEATDTDGCLNRSVPLGTKVRFAEGGSLVDPGTTVGTGTLAYSSWRTMRSRHEDDANTCAYNDLALVRVSKKDLGKVDPTMPFWGGPTGIARNGTAAGDAVYSYGNSSLRGGVTELSPKTGSSLGDDPTTDGWTHPLYTASPGIPGDSGSGFLDAQGRALGTLSTIGLAPLPASNNIGDLAKELAYAKAHSGLKGLHLVEGKKPFTGTPVGTPGG